MLFNLRINQSLRHPVTGNQRYATRKPVKAGNHVGDKVARALLHQVSLHPVYQRILPVMRSGHTCHPRGFINHQPILVDSKNGQWTRTWRHVLIGMFGRKHHRYRRRFVNHRLQLYFPVINPHLALVVVNPAQDPMA